MTYASTVSADSPVAWWKLNETSGTTATDSGSGTAANATYTGTCYLAQQGIDEADAGGGTAVGFGSDGYLTIASLPTKLQFASGTAFSIEAWVAFQDPDFRNPGAPNGTAPGVSIVTEAYSGDGTVRYFLGFNDGTARPSFGWYNGAWRLVQWTGTGSNIGDSNWHHLVGTFDGTQMRLYVDGTLRAGPTTPGGTQPGGTEALHIGKRWDSSDVFDGGFFDEIAMYSAALTSTQVSNHWGARNIGTANIRTTAVWTEAALEGATSNLRTTGLWVEVATEEFWHGFGTPEYGDGVDDADLGPGSSGTPGFIVAGIGVGRGKGRSRAVGQSIYPGTGPAYRKNVDYRNNSDYRG